MDDYFAILEDIDLSKLCPKAESTCLHLHVTEHRGIGVCVECGEELPDQFDNEKEYRFSNTKGALGRQIRKTYEKSIFKDLDAFGIPQNIQLIANDLYKMVSNDRIFRGMSRKAVIFSCVFIAYKKIGIPQSIEHLQGIFRINKKTVSKGIKIVGMALQSNESKMFLSVEDIIPEMLNRFDSPMHVKDAILQLYGIIKNRSSMINRSRPRSVAASLVYYFMKKTNKQFSDKLFCENVGLSKLTVYKLFAEVDDCVKEHIPPESLQVWLRRAAGKV